MVVTLQSLAETILKPFGLEGDMFEVEAMKIKILGFRQVLVQQDYSSNRRIAQQLVQGFNVQMIQVQEDKDKFYVSEVLPKPIILSKKMPFISVHTTMQGRQKRELGYLEPERVPYIEYGKFTKKGNYFTYENNRLLVYSETPAVRIRAIWDNPIEALLFAREETYKLACSEDTIESNCVENDDIVLEQTMAGRILTFFNSNASKRQEPSEATGN
jgi:hypothetical protein